MKANVLELLEEKMELLTNAQRKVADYIIKNPTEVAFVTVDKLSRLVETSTTTIMRLAFSLGYSGFAAFQVDLQELLRDRVAPHERLATNIKRLGRNKLVIDCAQMHIGNIKNTVEFLSDELIERAAESILSAKKVYVIGIRSSSTPAHYLYQGITRLRGNCELLIPDTVHLQDVMLSLTPEHLVIAISFPRYARRTVEIIRAAKNRGARILSITDGYSSPLARLSDVFLPCAFNSLTSQPSEIGAIFVADLLITIIAVKDPDLAERRLREIEKVYRELDSNVIK